MKLLKINFKLCYAYLMKYIEVCYAWHSQPMYSTRQKYVIKMHLSLGHNCRKFFLKYKEVNVSFSDYLLYTAFLSKITAFTTLFFYLFKTRDWGGSSSPKTTNTKIYFNFKLKISCLEHFIFFLQIYLGCRVRARFIDTSGYSK